MDADPNRTVTAEPPGSVDCPAMAMRRDDAKPAVNQRLTAATVYMSCGFLFGLAFPLGCLAILVATGRLDADAGFGSLVRQAHADNFLLYVVDTAPWVLALFARFAGVRQDRIRQFNLDLEVQIADKTRTLWVALEDARRAHETVLYMAQHDALTGLPNRTLLRQRIDQAITQARCSDQRAALVFFDLDKFKLVNDTLGHEAGDRLLREVADRLAHGVRGGDTVARMGGDEFVIVLADLSQLADAEAVIRKLLAAVAEPILIAGSELRVTASVGMSVFPEHGDTSDALMRAADKAMYRVKAEGRNSVRMFDPTMSAGDAGPVGSPVV